MLHTDFPETPVYYIFPTPAPSIYSRGSYSKPAFISLMETLNAYFDENDFVTGINVIDVLTENGQPKEGCYRSDGTHLTEEGYAIWTEYLKGVITFPENLGKWYLTSETEMLESGYVRFGTDVTIDFTGTEHAGKNGVTVTVADEEGNLYPVTRSGDAFTFVMPTTNVTVSVLVAETFTNSVVGEDGYVDISGNYVAYKAFETSYVLPEHTKFETLGDYLPETITSERYLYGYSVSSDGGETYGDVYTDASAVRLEKDDILKVHFVMMGTSSLASTNMYVEFGESTFDSRANTLTLGALGTLTTRYGGGLYLNGNVYQGNNYTVTMRVTISKKAATNNLVVEFGAFSKVAAKEFNGRKVFLRFEKNATVLYRQTTKTENSPQDGYAYTATKTATPITVASTNVLSITLDVTIDVTPTGCTFTFVNVDNTEQVYSETYTHTDADHAWENVEVGFAVNQHGVFAASNITVTDNSAENNGAESQSTPEPVLAAILPEKKND